MNFRMAKMRDLPQLKTVFRRIVAHMNMNDIKIWDDIFPCEFFQVDIEHNCLYILEDDKVIISAFALYESNDGESYVQWEDGKARVMYINRFGVNVDYMRQGIGKRMLKNAKAIAKQKGVEYVRLFVVDMNKPAIDLYLKNGFKQVEGIYEERFDDFVLREYGFEMRI